MTPINERLVDCAREIRQAPHGFKQTVYEKYCKELNYLTPTGEVNTKKLMMDLKKIGLNKKRATRSNANQHALPQQEAEEIVRWQRDNARANGKNIVCLDDAVNTLRVAGHIKAEAIDKATGEVKKLSISAIRQAIETYGLSAKRLNAPPPAIRMRTLHSNHVWQIDASLCVLYYLPKDGGLQIMHEAVFNTNKPNNLKKIENERVWRYLVVDHASGSIYVEYVFGGESGANLTQIFINAMQERKDEFWGVPKMVYCDAGSANTGAVFKGLCQQLGVKLEWHMPGNARATGSVEKAQDIVECKFESMLASRTITSLSQLNELAKNWRIRFNLTAVHSRHGQTRHNAWHAHISGHLISAPSVQACRDLANTPPKSRTVSLYLTISYEGKDWDVSHYPEVYVGMKVQVAKNPWAVDSIRIVDILADNSFNFFEAPLKLENSLGYWPDAAVLGESFKQHAITSSEIILNRLAERSAADQKNTVGKRAKPMPFGGKINPFAPLELEYLPTYLPRQANEVREVKNTRIETAPLSLAEACKFIKGIQGSSYNPATYAWLAARFADGKIPQEYAEAIAYGQEQVQATGTDNPHPTPTLRSVK